MVLSRIFLETLRNRVAAGERQYRIARSSDVHPTTLSQIINDALPLRAGDPRVVRVGKVLGLDPSQCFTSDTDGAGTK